MPTMSHMELGVVAIALLLVIKELLKFFKDVILPRLSGETKSNDQERARREALNDATSAQIASTMTQQAQILQQLTTLMSNHDSRFREFVEDFKDHEREVRKHSHYNKN